MKNPERGIVRRILDLPRTHGLWSKPTDTEMARRLLTSAGVSVDDPVHDALTAIESQVPTPEIDANQKQVLLALETYRRTHPGINEVKDPYMKRLNSALEKAQRREHKFHLQRRFVLGGVVATGVSGAAFGTWHLWDEKRKAALRHREEINRQFQADGLIQQEAQVLGINELVPTYDGWTAYYLPADPNRTWVPEQYPGSVFSVPKHGDAKILYPLREKGWNDSLPTQFIIREFTKPSDGTKVPQIGILRGGILQTSELRILRPITDTEVDARAIMFESNKQGIMGVGLQITEYQENKDYYKLTVVHPENNSGRR